MQSPFSKPVDANIADVNVDVHNRRRSERRPSVATAIVWVGPRQQIKACIIDESERGVGLQVPIGTRCVVGFKLRVEHSGMRRWATVRHVTESDGFLKVGLSWDY